MMAKITKGASFGGCVRYVLSKKDAQLIGANGVLCANSKTIIESFNAQAELNPRLGVKVGHISLNFSAQDKDKTGNAFMLKTSLEYMRKMGITDTQFIVVRHNDREHPHCHIVFNRVGNSGKTISDKNDRPRSVKACRELTEKYGLYLAEGKQNVKRERLREPDKTKYEIYDAIKKALPCCSDWNELARRLQTDGISVAYKFKGTTGQKEGVIFSKTGQSFNGSKIDRQFSFSKLDAALNANALRQQVKQDYSQTAMEPEPNNSPAAKQPNRTHEMGHPYHFPEYSGNTGIGGLFDFNSNPVHEPDDALHPEPRRKKKKRQMKL